MVILGVEIEQIPTLSSYKSYIDGAKPDPFPQILQLIPFLNQLLQIISFSIETS